MSPYALGFPILTTFFEDINNLASGILPETPIQNALTEKNRIQQSGN